MVGSMHVSALGCACEMDVCRLGSSYGPLACRFIQISLNSGVETQERGVRRARKEGIG